MPKSKSPDDLTDKQFSKIARHVYELARINLGENKRELVRARVGKLIREHNFSGYQEYCDYLDEEKTGEATRELLNAVSTNLTSFFRESKHFDFMSSVFVPDLIAAAGRGGSRTLRGWSAGCSTGEEIYTISITLAEALGDLHPWDVRLLATDIDTTVVAHGERGVYEKRKLETVAPGLLRKYFQRGTGRQAGQFRVKSQLRNLVTFRHLNLMGPWPFRSAFDFIFCRNVMIYFDRQTQEELVNRYYDVLKPGGYLFIGHSEGLSGVNHKFRYAQPTIYRK